MRSAAGAASARQPALEQPDDVRRRRRARQEREAARLHHVEQPGVAPGGDEKTRP
jgi:hypothetical protein